jgi:hypothetical protein
MISAVPADWQDHIDNVIHDADVTMAEYCMPAIERDIFPVPVLGRLAVTYAQTHLQVYQHVADSARRQGKALATADPANDLGFMFYNNISPLSCYINILAERWHRGPHMPIIGGIERFLPTTADSRRMIAAAGLRHVLQQLPETNIAYIAAPDHIARIRAYARRPLDGWDTWRQGYYRYAMPGLDRRLRIFQPTPDHSGWNSAYESVVV